MVRLLIMVILLTTMMVGCSEVMDKNSLTLSKKDRQTIDTYLKNQMNPELGDDIYVAYEVLASDQSLNELYIWALVEAYSDDISQGGSSIPMVLEVENHGDLIDIVDHQVPRDGNYFSEDIKEMFPEEIHSKIFDYPSKHIDELKETIKNKRESE